MSSPTAQSVPLIVVIGATGSQGGARLWALAQDPGRQLHELKPGQTVNAWAYEHEVAHAKGIIDAAAKVEGLKRFVWPSLTAAREISRGRYTWAYHFDSKANAAEYMKREYPELWAKTSRVQVRFYATNHSSLPFMRPQKVSDGVYEIAANFDDTIKIPYVVAETDTGPFVHALVTSVSAGKYLLAYREMICLRDVLKVWERVNDVKASVRRTSFEEDAALDMERAETFAVVNEYGYDGGDPEIVHAKDLGLDLTFPTMEDWIKEQDWSYVVAGQA